MSGIFNCASRRWSFSLVGLVSTVCVLSTLASPAWAVMPSPVGFTLEVSPYGQLLDGLDDFDDGTITSSQLADIMNDVNCDNPHLRVRARNKPAIMIISDDNSVAPLTSFTLNINEGPFFFSTGDVATDGFTGFVKPLTMYTDAGVTITGSSLSPDGKSLTVNFDGLTAGKRAIFNVDLDASDMTMFPFPDYRNVLFGAPWGPGDAPTDPASYSATFVNSSSPAPNSRVVSGQFAQLTEVPDWSNDNVRPYRDMDMVEHLPGGGAVPEPSSALMAMAAIAGMAVLGRRRTA